MGGFLGFKVFKGNLIYLDDSGPFCPRIIDTSYPSTYLHHKKL